MIWAPARREQQRTTDTKAAILTAALTEFARHGFEGATTRGIAARAAVNHPLIAHHFGSKADLWKATAEYLFGLYALRMANRRGDLAGAEEPVLLRSLLREFIRFCAEVPQFHLFMIQANQGDPARLRWLMHRFLARGSARELDVLAAAQRTGLFVAGDTAHLRYLFIGAAASIFTFPGEFERSSGRDPFDVQGVERHVELVMHVFNARERAHA
jgi:AcrR family transcriptional regulator